MRDIGKNIRLLRMKRNITQDELAEKLFVSRQTISNYETGRSRPDIDTLIRLSEILGADVQDLLYGPSVPKSQIIEKRRLLLGIVLLTIMVAFCVCIEYFIEYFNKAPSYLYCFQAGAAYFLWFILRPCLSLLIGWSVMQGLSLLPRVKVLSYDAKYVHKLIILFIVIYFIIVSIFCGWQLLVNWQSYQYHLSNSTEEFHRSFSVPIVIQCVRFFGRHHESFWAVFIPIGMFLWLTAGCKTHKKKNAMTDKVKKDES